MFSITYRNNREKKVQQYLVSAEFDLICDEISHVENISFNSGSPVAYVFSKISIESLLVLNIHEHNYGRTTIDFQKISLPKLEEIQLFKVFVKNFEKISSQLLSITLNECCLNHFEYPLSPNITYLNLMSNKNLSCDEKQIDLSRYIFLKHISIHHCDIKIFPLIPDNRCLSWLDVSCNKLDTCGFIPDCVRELYINDNQITHIERLPLQIRKVNLWSNPLKRLPANTLQCIHLTSSIDLYSTEIVLTLPEMRFMRRLVHRMTYEHTAYTDGQNVHNSNIQKSVLRSLQNLFSDTFSDVKFNTTGNVIADKIIHDNIKSHKDVHVILNVTYKEVFQKVWNRIHNSEHRDELLIRLKQETIDSGQSCFTGQISRLMNVFVGYYPDIQIHIGDADQISARIKNVLAKNNGMMNEREIRESLREIDVSEELITEWIQNIEESL